MTNQYSLSGQWVADGGSHAGTAKLWQNRLSDNLKAKLTAAGKDGDVSGFGSWAVIALPGPDSTEAVKASPTCAAASEPHCLLIQETGGEQGTMTQAGGPQLATLDQSVPNRVAFTYDVAIPVSLTGKGNAEGVMKGVLKVDLSYVPNPNPAAGGPEFLIDSIKNELTGTTTDVLASTPGLSVLGFESRQTSSPAFEPAALGPWPGPACRRHNERRSRPADQFRPEGSVFSLGWVKLSPRRSRNPQTGPRPPR